MHAAGRASQGEKVTDPLRMESPKKGKASSKATRGKLPSRPPNNIVTSNNITTGTMKEEELEQETERTFVAGTIAPEFLDRYAV